MLGPRNTVLATQRIDAKVCVCGRNGQEGHRTETGINLHELLAKPLQLDESAGRQNKMKVAVTWKNSIRQKAPNPV